MAKDVFKCFKHFCPICGSHALTACARPWWISHRGVWVAYLSSTEIAVWLLSISHTGHVKLLSCSHPIVSLLDQLLSAARYNSGTSIAGIKVFCIKLLYLALYVCIPKGLCRLWLHIIQLKLFQFTLIKGTREKQIALLYVDGFLCGSNIGTSNNFKASPGTFLCDHFMEILRDRANIYRPRSEGDNVLGSVRPSVRLSVRPSVRPSVCAVKSSRSHYQSKVFVCVSVISRRMRIIARMRSIGF